MTIGTRRSHQYSWNKFETLKCKQNLTILSHVGNYIASKGNKIRWIFISAIVASGICTLSFIRSSRAKAYCIQEETTYREAIDRSREVLRRRKDEVGSPGVVIGVSINGKTVWQEGLGYADVENRVPCTENTVMRIASISKSLTMAAVAKLWEEGKLDLDKPVKDYVPSFPEKTFEGKKVDITCRHLVSHLSGIRHYDKKVLEKDSEKQDSKTKKEEKNKSVKESDEISKKNENEQKSEFDLKEYFIKEKYESVKDSLDLFKDDPLVHKPGTKFLYTTHGWTLLSAVVEALAEKPFAKFMCKLFKDFGMTNTHLDTNDALIYHRARFYYRDKKGHLQNTPYVDNSYKWAGGGFLSTVGDLLRFGNIMLYSLQYKAKDLERTVSQPKELQKAEDNVCHIETSRHTEELCCNTTEENSKTTLCTLPGYLKDETVRMIWLPVENASPNWEGGIRYGMGWGIVSQKQECGYCRDKNFQVLHSGGAVGASSILLILPRECDNADVVNCKWECPPQGIIVAILTNMQAVSLAKTATQIAKIFQENF